MAVENEQQTGLEAKYMVFRRDGRDGPRDKHFKDAYFVLDLTHDPHAVPALRAYAESCEEQYPLLARDLYLMLTELEQKHQS